jgi:hypothetical protein
MVERVDLFVSAGDEQCADLLPPNLIVDRQQQKKNRLETELMVDMQSSN